MNERLAAQSPMNDKPIAPPSERDRQAHAWFARLRDRQASLQDFNAFAQWREDPLNAHAYRNAETLWQLMERPARTPPSRPRHRNIIVAILLMALCAAILISPPLDTWGSDYSTPPGQHQDLTLADGSTLHMDSDTALDIDINNDERLVRLRRGRVFLHVSHEDRPFMVTTATTWVRVTGTQFAVAPTSHQDDIILLRGSLEVAAFGQHQKMKPGQRLQVNDHQVHMPHVVDAERLLGWRTGHLVAQDTPLREVLEELMHHQGGHVIWLDSQVGQRLITTDLDLNDVPNALAQLIRNEKLNTTTLTDRLLIVRG
ncbi:MAG: Protein FecR [Pseudomonas fluorescens]|nr:MAG: Protein FecR [Pseudomonas fluorescens]